MMVEAIQDSGNAILILSKQFAAQLRRLVSHAHSPPRSSIIIRSPG
jgi:hypothetical protein